MFSYLFQSLDLQSSQNGYRVPSDTRPTTYDLPIYLLVDSGLHSGTSDAGTWVDGERVDRYRIHRNRRDKFRVPSTFA